MKKYLVTLNTITSDSETLEPKTYNIDKLSKEELNRITLDIRNALVSVINNDSSPVIYSLYLNIEEDIAEDT